MKQFLFIIICILFLNHSGFAKEKYDFSGPVKKNEKMEIMIDGKKKKVKVSSEYIVWANKGAKCVEKLYMKVFYKKKILTEVIMPEAKCVNIAGIGPSPIPKLILTYVRSGTIKYKVIPLMFDADGMSIKETDEIQFLSVGVRTGAKKRLLIERYKTSFLIEAIKSSMRSDGLTKEEIDSIDLKAEMNEIIFDNFAYGIFEATFQTSMMQNFSTVSDFALFTNRDETNFIDEIINKIEASKNNDYPYSLTNLEINKIRDFEKIKFDEIYGFQPRN